MRNTIINYLTGNRLYLQGVELYERYGHNVALKHSFRIRPESRLMRLTLIEELRKLAGLTEEELANIERMETTGPAFALRVEQEEPQYRTLTAKETERVRFRDRFPFLREDSCPDVLKLLVNEMFASYDRYRDAHNKLADLPDDAPLEQAAELTEIAVEDMLNDRMIWEELTHYQEHKRLLGKHPKVERALEWMEYREMSDFDLVRKHNNAKINVSKCKNKIEAAQSEEDREKYRRDYHRWQTVKNICEDEIERRKRGE